jgi:TolB-like protein
MSVCRKDKEQRQYSPKSIAVLPFFNMTNDPGQEVFCDSITEELINVLTRVDGLGVSAVLEGSVRMLEERVRVTAQLSSAADGFHLCSETFDVKFERDFAVQEQLAAAIATMTQRFIGN